MSEESFRWFFAKKLHTWPCELELVETSSLQIGPFQQNILVQPSQNKIPGSLERSLTERLHTSYTIARTFFTFSSVLNVENGSGR